MAPELRAGVRPERGSGRKWWVTEETSGLVRAVDKAAVLQTVRPLCLEVYVPQRRTAVDISQRGMWGRRGGSGSFWWFVYQLSVLTEAGVFQPHCLFAHFYSSSWILPVLELHSAPLSRLLRDLSPFRFFLFAVSFFLFSSHRHRCVLSRSLLSSCPSLLPSILQTSVGSRTISRGSRRPAAPSLLSLPAIVPAPTAAQLLHSINPQHAAGVIHLITLTFVFTRRCRFKSSLLPECLWAEHCIPCCRSLR